MLFDVRHFNDFYQKNIQTNSRYQNDTIFNFLFKTISFENFEHAQ